MALLNKHAEKGPGERTTQSAKKPRDMRLDALRGYFLLLMAAEHVPTPVSHFVQDPLGFNGAAEGFIFLSACLAGLVYGKTFLQSGPQAMMSRIWKRTRWIYIIHLSVLLPTLLVAWPLASHVIPLANHFHNFLLQPLRNLLLTPLLLNQPPLFDILPLYVIFLGLTPFLLMLARRYGWGTILVVSAVIWLTVQVGLEPRLTGRLLSSFNLGPFNLTAWQFLWACGAVIGETSVRHELVRKRFRVALAVPALIVVLSGFLIRHGYWPQAWWNPDLFLWLDKWKLGPLRLLNFAGWVALMLAWNPHPSRWLMAVPALLGRHSLAVFAMHLPLVIAATTVIQVFALSDTAQTFIGLSVVALLFPWAAWLDRKKFPPQTTTPTFDASVKPSSPPMPAAG
jgi:hypothetical protein